MSKYFGVGDQFPTTTEKRLVTAPDHGNCTGVISVLLADDENVEWIWTHTPNESWVSGYRIIKKDD